MPGIVGIVSQRPPEECQVLVKSMASSMEHESFYDSGMYSVPEMGIYAGWVAHENSLGAGQPFFNERRDVVLLLSGECFGAELQETFKRVLPRYFESESRIGISLTAGLDSRMIMACLPKGGEKPVCYTFAGQKRNTL